MQQHAPARSNGTSPAQPVPSGSTRSRAQAPAPALREGALRALRRAIVLAGLALGGLAITVVAVTTAEFRTDDLVLHEREIVRLGRSALALAVEQQSAILGYLLTRDPAALAPDVVAHATLGPTLDSLATATADNPEQHARARAIRDAVTRWDRAYRTPLLAAIRAGATPDARTRGAEGMALFDQVRTRIGTFVEIEESLYRAGVESDRFGDWGALGAVLAQVLLLLVLVIRIGREARRRTATVFRQQEQLEEQAVDLEHQAAQLEEQAAELEAQTEELSASNHALTESLAEEARALDAMRASEARFRSVIEAATDAIITSDASGRILLWNAAAQRVYGHTAAEAIGGQIASLIPEARREAHRREYAALVARRAPHLADGVVVRDAVRRDGTVFPVELAVSRWEAGGEAYVTSIVRDVSARVALEERMAHEASHDPLTGLANRTRFRERVATALARDPAHPDHVAVLFLDLDDFKSVNDTAGHAVGDELLCAVAERLLDATRGTDTVARLGGDEFGILLWHVDGAADADFVAGRLLAAMRRPVTYGDREAPVSVSVGIARGATGLDADALLRNADTAMYAAKDEGKGDYRWFAPAMHAALVERAQIHADLGSALERGEFRLVYQPIVALDSGRVQGVEALIRWTHPERGPLSPAAFIPVAEAGGQIVPIGCWVLEEACRTVATLPGEPYVSVNISARQLGDPALVGDVAAALRETGLAPERLVLEITETVLMADIAGTRERLDELKALGVRLAIDDFGTGYSSLRYLQRFPVDVLKIDKTFVDGVDVDGHDAALVRTIVALADMLGVTTVSEGIERAAQREHLLALGCALGQGYHFARPLDAAAVAALLAGGGAIDPAR